MSGRTRRHQTDAKAFEAAAARHVEYVALLEQAADDIEWALEHMVFVDDPRVLDRDEPTELW